MEGIFTGLTLESWRESLENPAIICLLIHSTNISCKNVKMAQTSALLKRCSTLGQLHMKRLRGDWGDKRT
jgi:hypothetical protein